MKGRITLEMEAEKPLSTILLKIIEIESESAPEGGSITPYLNMEEKTDLVGFRMESNDPSTLRAMLNSYAGLISAAERTANDDS